MEHQESQIFYYPPHNRPPLPNATAVLVLGIISIVGCMAYGIVGLVCGIIALYLSKKDLALYEAFPEKYSTTSFNNLKAGRTCATIGSILSGILVAFFLLLFFGVFAFAIFGNH